DRALAGHPGTGAVVRAAFEFLRRSGAAARSHWTLGCVGLFGGPTKERNRYSHGAGGANRQRLTVGRLARNEAGVVWTDRGCAGGLWVEAPPGEPVFRRGCMAAPDGLAALWCERH